MDQEFKQDQQFKDGLRMRKQVMGEDFVDKAFTNADEFTMPLQEFITRNAWARCGAEMDSTSRPAA